MKIENINRVIGGIDDDLIDSADRERGTSHKNGLWIRLGAVSAALLIFVFVLFIPAIQRGIGKLPGTDISPESDKQTWNGEPDDIAYENAPILEGIRQLLNSAEVSIIGAANAADAVFSHGWSD